MKLHLLNTMTGKEFAELVDRDLSFTHQERVWVYDVSSEGVSWKWKDNVISTRVKVFHNGGDELAFGPFVVNGFLQVDYLIEAVTLF